MAGLFGAIWLGLQGAAAIHDAVDNAKWTNMMTSELPNGELYYTDRNFVTRLCKNNAEIVYARNSGIWYEKKSGRTIYDERVDERQKHLDAGIRYGVRRNFFERNKPYMIFDEVDNKPIYGAIRRSVHRESKGFPTWFYSYDKDGAYLAHKDKKPFMESIVGVKCYKYYHAEDMTHKDEWIEISGSEFSDIANAWTVQVRLPNKEDFVEEYGLKYIDEEWVNRVCGSKEIFQMSEGMYGG